MLGLKHILDSLAITILNIELCPVDRRWNYRHVNNPYSRLYLITEGSGSIIHHNTTYILKPGYLYLIPCFTTVDMHCEDSFMHYFIHFTSRIQTGLDILSVLTCNYEAKAEEHNIDTDTFEQLMRLNPNRELFEHDAKKRIYPQILQRAGELDREQSPANIMETTALMLRLLAAFFRGHDHPAIANTVHGLSRFREVIDYVHDNLDAVITLEELAEIASLSPAYFSDLFSRLMGVSPIQYVNKQRIETAQQQLLSTNQPLQQIAAEVGFTDPYYFSRMFKKIVGVAPSFYRRQRLL